jgi:hypothetical protein
MKHKLTIDQRLTGAHKALAKLDRMGPRYRGLVVGIKKNIRNLEEYRDRGFEFMPYKDRETYLRKQREFHARRKARAQTSRVSTNISLTPANSYTLNANSERLENRLPVSGKRVPNQPVSGVSRASVPLTPPTPRLIVQKQPATKPIAKSCKPARSPQFKTALDLFRPFPLGMSTSQVCPFCNNTRFSSPGTPCSYCR